MAEISTLTPVTEAQIAEKMRIKAVPVQEKIPETNGAQEKIPFEEKPAEKPLVEKPLVEKPAEEKPVEAPKKKSLKDLAKPFTGKPKAEVTPIEEVPEKYKTKLTEYETKVKELADKIKSYEEDSGYQLLVEARKAGKDAWDLFDQVKGEDVSKLSDIQLYELNLRKSGVKDADDITDSEESSIQEEMEKFRSQPKTARDREIAEIRKQYSEANNNKASEFFNKLKTVNQQREETTQSQRNQEIELARKTQESFDKMCDDYIGNEHMTVVGTPQMAESLKNILRNPDALIPKKEDGSLDEHRLFELAHYVLFKDLMLENLENQFRSEGFNELREQVEVTGGAKTGIVRAPQTSTKTEKEVKEYIHSTLRPVN